MEVSVFILFSLLLLCLNGSFAAAMTMGNESDRLALLDFKGLLADPTGALSTWNDSTHFCQWEGVSCSRKHPERVTALDLTSRSLSGPISPSIVNLTFLQTILLATNGFYGEIPPELGRLRRLQILDLDNNSFHGVIPINLTNCSQLTTLYLNSNQLIGRIPAELGSLSKLSTLDLGNNSISGLIPPSLGNLTSLTTLFLPLNHLEGHIPEDLGKVTSLISLQVALNMLSGEIPPSIYNLSSLLYMDVAYNQMLNGSLPPSLGITIPKLRYLLLGGNQFHGPIPASLTNMTSLVEFDIAYNNFSGRVPPDLGRLTGLSHLNLGRNQLEANDADDWKFLESLSNCSGLQGLFLSYNKFGGILPPSVTNLSTRLQKLEMSYNQISGSIPSGIGDMVNLNTLQMQANLFTGTIPESIGKLKSLYLLILFGNWLRGRIPSSLIGNLTQLLRFRLEDNNLEGSIPPSLGNLQNPSQFDLSNNNLSGTIPKEIFSLHYLSDYMDLSYNYLDGPLPSEVGFLENVGLLLLGANKLSGEIPSTLGNCESLEYLGMNRNFFNGTIPQSLGNIRALKGLNLSQNNLSGSIPLSFSKLNGLQELYLSYNNLSGSIPEFLENLTFLFQLSLSFNHLQGEVPIDGVFKNATAISILGNDGLCGGIPELHLPACPLKTFTKRRGWSLIVKRVVIVAAAIICLLLITFFAYLYWKRKLRNKITSLPALEDQFPKVSYGELVKTTDGFSSVNLIGRGRYGSVYKGTLDGGDTFVAIKVFNLQEHGASKSFVAECEALRSIRHRNLIKILTSCSSVDYKGNDFKALVFDFMPNGSLDTWLHPGEAPNNQTNGNLSLIQRLNIAIDVANALEYLHHNCQPPVVHCDLKPSNVLLDECMGAHVGDFGLAKFHSEVVSKSFDSTSSIGIRGTVGYVAQEYGAGGQVSTSGDVYSFGILLLELFTGKRPVDSMFDDGLNLRKFVEMGASNGQVMEIADPLMLLQDQLAHGSNGSESTVAERIRECLESVMRLGLWCANQSPRERMHIRDAAAEMHSIKKAYLRVNDC